MRSLFVSERYRELAFVGFLMGTLLVFLLAAEAALRLEVQNILPLEEREGEYVEFWQEVGFVVPEISTYRARPNSEFDGIEINSLGFRGPDIETPKPDGRVRIAVLGNSTVLALGLGEAETIPAQLVAQLSNRNPACRFDYLSVSGADYTHSDLEWLMTHGVNSVEVDHVVIVHTGAGRQPNIVFRDKFYEKFRLFWHLRDTFQMVDGQWRFDKTVPDALRNRISAEVASLERIVQSAPQAEIWYQSVFRTDHAQDDPVKNLWMEETTAALSAYDQAAFSKTLQSIPSTSAYFLSPAHYTPKGAAMAAQLIADDFFAAYPEQNALCK